MPEMLMLTLTPMNSNYRNMAEGRNIFHWWSLNSFLLLYLSLSLGKAQFHLLQDLLL